MVQCLKKCNCTNKILNALNLSVLVQFHFKTVKMFIHIESQKYNLVCSLNVLTKLGYSTNRLSCC